MAEDAASAAAAAVIDDLVGDSAEAPEATGEQTAPETPVEVNLPSFVADIDGIEELLEEPDYFDVSDDEDDEPVVAEQDDYSDPETSRLKAKLAKLEKQNRFLSEQRTKENLKNWRAEAARRFPLADANEIVGTSRRAVLAKAKDQHDRYSRKLEPVLKTLDEIKAGVIQSARQEAREQAAQQWGRPTSAPQPAQVEDAEKSAELDPRNYKNAHELVLARIRNGFQI